MLNICKFKGCGITFPRLPDLIEHIEDVHIGKYTKYQLYPKFVVNPPRVIHVPPYLRLINIIRLSSLCVTFCVKYKNVYLCYFNILIIFYLHRSLPRCL